MINNKYFPTILLSSDLVNPIRMEPFVRVKWRYRRFRSTTMTWILTAMPHPLHQNGTLSTAHYTTTSS